MLICIHNVNNLILNCFIYHVFYDRVPPVLMMHFVKGLPHNDLKMYSFQFKEDSYLITAVIQYLQKTKHFVAWIFNEDGNSVHFYTWVNIGHQLPDSPKVRE